ncbi:hypothetical protein NO1_2276, partial [Candidatus Termititenax aidoneus]
PNVMIELAKARTINETAENIIKNKLADAAVRKLSRSILAEPKPLKLVGK